VYPRRVGSSTLVFSLSSDWHSEMGFIFNSLSLSIHNKQNKFLVWRIKKLVGVLCPVLTNSPKSCTSQWLFIIFDSVTYNDDQKKSHTDSIELSMETQFISLTNETCSSRVTRVTIRRQYRSDVTVTSCPLYYAIFEISHDVDCHGGGHMFQGDESSCVLYFDPLIRYGDGPQ
jgi:hypothetical protein